jgi:hypothetical protein
MKLSAELLDSMFSSALLTTSVAVTCLAATAPATREIGPLILQPYLYQFEQEGRSYQERPNIISN